MINISNDKYTQYERKILGLKPDLVCIPLVNRYKSVKDIPQEVWDHIEKRDKIDLGLRSKRDEK